MIARAFPDAISRGEIVATPRGEREHLWIVDPIDGTHKPCAGFHIGTCRVVVERVRTLGAAHDPARDELFHARRGGGAFARMRRNIETGLH
jgi:myo-inositol-1(or 4)-monophosphatase